jgi:hypothetical protein
MGEGNLGTKHPFSPRKGAQILEKCTSRYVTPIVHLNSPNICATVYIRKTDFVHRL